VALLHLLKNLSYPLVVGHLDHALRPGSAADARFVKALADAWDLPSRIERENVKAYARKHRLGIEEAARDRRYRTLYSMAKTMHCAAVVTAHTLDDQAETVLMNFLRGSGPAGLAGIPSIRTMEKGGTVQLIRPLLRVAKSEVLLYAKSHFLKYRTDPSNKSPQFTRNRIRQTVLPSLEKEYRGLKRRLAQAADIFREEEDFWEAEIRRSQTVVLRRLFGYHKALVRRILRRLLPGSSFLDIEQVMHWARSAKKTGFLELSNGWRVSYKKGTLHFQHKRKQ
jgi:tRNA(Ile)-lysidine synthase